MLLLQEVRAETCLLLVMLSTSQVCIDSPESAQLLDRKRSRDDDKGEESKKHKKHKKVIHVDIIRLIKERVSTD